MPLPKANFKFTSARLKSILKLRYPWESQDNKWEVKHSGQRILFIFFSTVHLSFGWTKLSQRYCLTLQTLSRSYTTFSNLRSHPHFHNIWQKYCVSFRNFLREIILRFLVCGKLQKDFIIFIRFALKANKKDTHILH